MACQQITCSNKINGEVCGKPVVSWSHFCQECYDLIFPKHIRYANKLNPFENLSIVDNYDFSCCQESTPNIRCKYRFQRGQSKGQLCGNLANYTGFCRTCIKKRTVQMQIQSSGY